MNGVMLLVQPLHPAHRLGISAAANSGESELPTNAIYNLLQQNIILPTNSGLLFPKSVFSKII